MILVTGGAGFIGSNVVAGLVEDGREVAVCDTLGEGDKWRNLSRHELAEVITPRMLPAFLATRGLSEQLEAIIHLGAITATDATNANLVVRTNFALSQWLWRWCVTHACRFFYASSAATYGDGGQGFSDQGTPEALSRLRPLTLYGWSKHLFDRFAVRAVAAHRPVPRQWVGLKFFNVYGPNEYHKGTQQSVVVQVYRALTEGRSVRLFRSLNPLYGDGEQRRDFVWVGDCVEVIRWLLDHDEVSGLFNVGTESARTFNELVASVFAAAGRRAAVEYVLPPVGSERTYQYQTRADVARLRAAGYIRPFTSLEDGVARYVNDYLSTGDPYR